MNKLSNEDRVRVVACLVEGNSLRATVRMTGVHRTTILKLLVDLGTACSEYQDRTLRNLPCKLIQVDEIWSFVGAKEKNASTEQKAKGWGDIWTWVALDPASKLVASWYVGERHAGAGYHFLSDLKDRLAHRIQLTSDGHRSQSASPQPWKRALPITSGRFPRSLLFWIEVARFRVGQYHPALWPLPDRLRISSSECLIRPLAT